MRIGSGIGRTLGWARWLLIIGWVAGCTVGDPDDFDFEDGSVDGSRPIGRDGGLADTGAPDDEDGGGQQPQPDAGGQMTGGIKLSDLPRLMAEATCAALEDCVGSAELLADQLGGRDCAELNENLLLAGPMRYLPESVAAGLVLFRPAEAADCIEDLRGRGCDARGSRLPASCELTLLGTVEQGQACTIDHDCEGDAFCAFGELASCPGACAPQQAEGMPCFQNNDDQCKDGLVCFRGHCEKLGAKGDDCSDTLPRCAPGLLCSGGECVSVPTVYFRKLDESCMIGTQLCEPGLVCESTMGTMGVCKKPVAKGAACKRADPNQCPIDQYCDAMSPGMSGTCRDRPSNGQACLNRTQSCAPDHVCIDNACLQLLQVGETCAVDAQCYSGDCGTNSKCAGPLMCEP